MSTAELDRSTKLAVDRTRVAYDRTMMAWIRTGTSLISFGFATYKFFQFDAERLKPHDQLIGTRSFGLLMVAIGLSSLVLGTIEHWKNMRLLAQEYPNIPRSRTTLVAFLISAAGILALLAVIFRE